VFIYEGKEKSYSKLFKLAIRPLLEKGKPIVRWGRKATGQAVP